MAQTNITVRASKMMKRGQYLTGTSKNKSRPIGAAFVLAGVFAFLSLNTAPLVFIDSQ